MYAASFPHALLLLPWPTMSRRPPTALSISKDEVDDLLARARDAQLAEQQAARGKDRDSETKARASRAPARPA